MSDHVLFPFTRSELPKRLFWNNIDSIFPSEVTNAWSLKVQSIGPRGLLMNTAAVALYEQPPEMFMEYVGSLLGKVPMVFAPSTPCTDLTLDLSLRELLTRTRRFLLDLFRFGKDGGWSIDPFYVTPGVHQLSSSVNLPVIGTAREHVNRGAVDWVNGKEPFTQFWVERGYPMPDFVLVQSWKDLLSEAAKCFERHPEGIFIKQSRAEGGLGNCRVTRATLKAGGYGKHGLRRFLETELGSHQDRWSASTLICPSLPFACCPSILLEINDDGPRLYAHTTQIMDPGGTGFIGSILPSGLESGVIEELADLATVYGSAAYARGFRGGMSFDVGILSRDFRCGSGRKFKAGSLIPLECNGREGANGHVIAVRQALCPGDPSVVSQSNDAFKLSPRATLEDALAFMAERGLHWNTNSEEGVILTIPPFPRLAAINKNTMGYLVLVGGKGADLEKRRRVKELNTQMAQFDAENRRKQ